jgi:hypothetical protein
MDLIKVLADISKSSVQWISVTRTLPSLAERVVVVGSPMGLEQTVSEGIVSSIRVIPDIGKILQISAAVSSGSSGSPVVNMKGQVVGVVSFYLIKGQNLNFAVPAQYLIDLKPSRTIKTISEWTYGIDKKTPRKTPRKGRLFVQAETKGAKIRILNIKPKFYQGIVLIPGPYHIEVSADGYEMKKFWIKIEPDEDKKVVIRLDRVAAGIPGDRFTNSLGMEFVYIPAGSFMMGSPVGEIGHHASEKQHRVTLTRGFYMQATEVTQGQWKAVMGDNPSRFFRYCGDNCPVEMISWQDTQEFIRRLNRKESRNKYRLPTEAEWEYASRADSRLRLQAVVSRQKAANMTVIWMQWGGIVGIPIKKRIL